MSAMQGSILVEQRNELASLKNDAAFEDSAMASLQEDERKMESDERKVDDDRKRKFGKHKKRWRDDHQDKKAVDEEKVDLDTKIRQFSDSLGHSDDDKNDQGGEDHYDDHSEDHEIEKRDHIPGSFDLGDDMLEDFASPDDHNTKKHAKKNSIVTESSSLSASSESPAQILGNIAKIFENVNHKNEALLVRKRKNNILRDKSPRSHDVENKLVDRNEDDEGDEEDENEFRKIKSVIPRAPKSKLTKYDVIGHHQKYEAPLNGQVSDGKLSLIVSCV